MSTHVVAVLVSFGFSPHWAADVQELSYQHGITPAETAGVILSEHNGTLKATSATVVNKSSGCIGLGQIAPWWAHKFGLPSSEALKDPRVNIAVTSHVIRVLKEEHGRCGSGRHRWLAHYKCTRASLERCSGPTIRAERWIARVQDRLDSYVPEDPAARAAPLAVLGPYQGSSTAWADRLRSPLLGLRRPRW